VPLLSGRAFINLTGRSLVLASSETLRILFSRMIGLVLVTDYSPLSYTFRCSLYPFLSVILVISYCHRGSYVSTWVDIYCLACRCVRLRYSPLYAGLRRGGGMPIKAGFVLVILAVTSSSRYIPFPIGILLLCSPSLPRSFPYGLGCVGSGGHQHG